MKLSKRLERLAGMVTPGNRLADVGTDHGYVPICLYEENRIPSAIAMDFHKGPLERAENHIKAAGLERYIETRHSDGLAALKEGEADTVLIAGMGGALMQRILEEGRTVLFSVKELVLQPQSEIAGIRQQLEALQWRIICEDTVCEDGKYYFMMKAVHGREAHYTTAEHRYGRMKYQRSLSVLEEYLGRQVRIQQEILSGLPGEGSERSLARAEFIRKDIRILKQALDGCIQEQTERKKAGLCPEEERRKEPDGKMSGFD